MPRVVFYASLDDLESSIPTRIQFLTVATSGWFHHWLLLEGRLVALDLFGDERPSFIRHVPVPITYRKMVFLSSITNYQRTGEA